MTKYNKRSIIEKNICSEKLKKKVERNDRDEVNSVEN